MLTVRTMMQNTPHIPHRARIFKFSIKLSLSKEGKVQKRVQANRQLVLV